jgi:3-methyladenine DNA glycosylase/8-oxoguanine DNA glycosylase
VTDKRSAEKPVSSPNLGDPILIFEEPVPYEFDFSATVKAHGWVALSPFGWDEASTTLTRTHRLDGGTAVRLHLTGGQSRSREPIKISVEVASQLKAAEQAEIRRAVRRMLRLDEDLSEFHRLNSQLDNWNLELRPGTGRLLRCPRLFEDIVYTLCTTNIAWSGTKRMVARLASSLGDSFPGSNQDRAFPSAEAIAAVDPQFLRREAGLGYRSDYIWEFASAVAGGQLVLTAFEDPGHASEELYRLLRQIKGVGDYAAATILMLLGRYDRLAIDSELRAFVTKKYFDDQPVDAGQIRAIYAPWGRWQYLAYWFDASG